MLRDAASVHFDKPDTEQTRARLGIEETFILFVGTIEPRKNLITLLRAFAEVLQNTDLRPQLVIAGQKGWLMDEIDVLRE